MRNGAAALISSAFDWELTPEGDEWWSGVYRQSVAMTPRGVVARNLSEAIQVTRQLSKAALKRKDYRLVFAMFRIRSACREAKKDGVQRFEMSELAPHINAGSLDTAEGSRFIRKLVELM